MQEYLTQQLRNSDPCLAHSRRVRLVDFGFEQAVDEREEHFGKYGRPFLVVSGREFGRLKGALEAGECAAPDGSVGIFTLHAEAGEDGGPVGYPGFVSFEMRLLDQGRYTICELIHEIYGLLATFDLFALPAKEVRNY